MSLGLNLLGRRIVGVLRRLLLFFLRHRHILNETLLGDAIVSRAIEGRLKGGQILIGDVETAVVGNPVTELATADKALIVAVHVFEKTLTIEL